MASVVTHMEIWNAQEGHLTETVFTTI